MNRKAKEEWEKKQAEAEKLRKQNEVSPVHFNMYTLGVILAYT